MELIELIIESNLFNFLIMLAIIAYVVKKFDLLKIFDDSISKIKETIEKSELAKENSINELKEANEKTKNLQQEIEKIEENAQQNIKNTEKRIEAESENKINSYKNNADKIIDAKGKEIISKLSKKTVLASFEIAQRHIIELLKQNPTYHEKFIKQSIEELDRLK